MTTLEQIQRVEQRLRQAMLSSDVDELDALLSDDLLATGPDGQLLGKADDLAAHQTGIIRIKTMVCQETTIKLLPEVAIVFVLRRCRDPFRINRSSAATPIRVYGVARTEIGGFWRHTLAPHRIEVEPDG